MELPEVTFDEIDRYLKITRQKGARILSTLGKIAPDINILFSTEVGKELLCFDINLAEKLTDKVALGKADEREKVILSYLMQERIPFVMDKLRTYLNSVGEIKAVASRK